MANRNLHDHPFVEEKILIPEIFEDYLKKWLSTFVMSNAYDGIWACASLLHVARTDLPDVLRRLHKLMKPNGILYASFKYGTGERIKEGRYFCDFTQESCRSLMEQAGFGVIEIFVTGDVREGRGDEKWVNVIAEKVSKEPSL